MNITAFWHIIEQTKQHSADDHDHQVALLRDTLSGRDAEDIIAFDRVFTQLMAQSYTRELWAAAYIINGGCSDDCFDYFRGWLIAQGEAVFTAALHDAQTLVDVAEEDGAELEDILSVAEHAYTHVTGQPLPSHAYIPLQLNAALWDESTMYDQYPRLAAKFGAS